MSEKGGDLINQRGGLDCAKDVWGQRGSGLGQVGMGFARTKDVESQCGVGEEITEDFTSVLNVWG